MPRNEHNDRTISCLFCATRQQSSTTYGDVLRYFSGARPAACTLPSGYNDWMPRRTMTISTCSRYLSGIVPYRVTKLGFDPLRFVAPAISTACRVTLVGNWAFDSALWASAKHTSTDPDHRGTVRNSFVEIVRHTDAQDG